MTRFLETFYARRPLVVLLIVACLGVAGAIVLVSPPTYQSSARLWFETTAVGTAVPAGADQSQGGGTTTPAQAGVEAFNQLLATLNFATHVGQGGPLGAYVTSHTVAKATEPVAAQQEDVDSTIETILQKNTAVTTDGPNVVGLTFNHENPQVAKGTLSAMLAEFSSEISALQLDNAKQLSAYYMQQAASMQTQVDNANANLDRYLRAHPELRVPQPPPDASFSALEQVAQDAQQRLNTVKGSLDQVTTELQTLASGGNGVFRTIDEPQTPTHRLNFVRSIAVGAGAGLAIGLVCSVILIGMLAAVDTSVRSRTEIERALGLKVVGSVPLLRGLHRKMNREAAGALGSNSPG